MPGGLAGSTALACRLLTFDLHKRWDFPGMLTSNRLGLALGGFTAMWHLFWLTMVKAGWAQPLIDGLFLLNFIDPPFHVREFVLARAVLLVPLSAAIAYVGGVLLGSILNGVSHHRSDRGSEALRELKRFVILGLILGGCAFMLTRLLSRVEPRTDETYRLERLLDEAEKFLAKRNRE